MAIPQGSHRLSVLILYTKSVTAEQIAYARIKLTGTKQVMEGCHV
ncbi:MULTISPECIES: hypothetical protein [Aerosakkonema]